MSDDEQSPAPLSVPVPSDDGKAEVKIRMEQEAKRRRERAEEEWREYEEFRHGEREKAEEEIRQLRERREQRKAERAEEEKRLAELRQVEEQKRRAEEEERQRKKREEEQRKREERERKKQEWEERKQANRPNFVITKKEGGELQAPLEEKKEEVTKSKEQLEAERKAIIEQRVPPLNTSGLSLDQLKAKAKELHDLLFRIEGENYDLGQRFKRQSYDMQELAERARQMNKGGKARAIPNELDARAAKFSGIPPMVAMYSQYERVKDPRSFGDRRTVFSGENYADEFQRIAPKHRIVMTDDGFQVKDSADSGAPRSNPAEVVAAE